MAGADHPTEIRIVPANHASWEDLQAIFGTRGDPARFREVAQPSKRRVVMRIDFDTETLLRPDGSSD